jgi:hypothetical protein
MGKVDVAKYSRDVGQLLYLPSIAASASAIAWPLASMGVEEATQSVIVVCKKVS